MAFRQVPQLTSVVVISQPLAGSLTPERIETSLRPRRSASHSVTLPTTIRIESPRIELRRDGPQDFLDRELPESLIMLIPDRPMPAESIGINFHTAFMSQASERKRIDALFTRLLGGSLDASVLGFPRSRAWGVAIKSRRFGADITVEMKRFEIRSGVSADGVLLTTNYDIQTADTDAVKHAVALEAFARISQHFIRTASRLEEALA